MMDFLQNHSDTYLKTAFSADRHERLENPDGYGKCSRDCGDTLEIFLIIEESTIKNIFFVLAGCIHTNACANMLAELAEGQSVTSARIIKTTDIIDHLETLPPKEHHCAELALKTFFKALSNYQEIRQSPWKKKYYKTG